MAWNQHIGFFVAAAGKMWRSGCPELSNLLCLLRARLYGSALCGTVTLRVISELFPVPSVATRVIQ